MDIVLTHVQIVDLFFRFAAVGQLLFLSLFLIKRHLSLPLPHIALILCIAGYVLLTAPIENRHYGGLRHVLLLLTDLTPFAAMWFTLAQLDQQFALSKVNKWIVLPVTIWVLCLVYFFLVMGGRGFLHDINHGVGIALLLSVIYLSLSEYIDDLDNRRRNTRLIMVAICSLHMAALVMFEFVYQGIRDTWQFSLFNAVTFCFACSLLGGYLMFKPDESERKSESVTTNGDSTSTDEPQLQRLNELMKAGAFLQSELTIGKLAQQLDVPAHRLRQLINQQLGFSNFSHYLNSYRIPWVCKQLQDCSKKHIPVLTLALEAGYGSIAPFNRAFKTQMQQTPKQYRDQF